MIKIANAPCSWGVLEFDLEGEAAGYEQVLDEIKDTGYLGTELGDWGFMPTDPAVLRNEIQSRSLELLGAFVPVGLKDKKNHETGSEIAIKTANLMVKAGYHNSFIVLSDDNGKDPIRTNNAGRVSDTMGLSEDQWEVFAEGANQVARNVKEHTGLRTVFHHHCAGFVETYEEVAKLMDLTDPGLLGLCLDTGHLKFAGGDPEKALVNFADRIWHVHFKDCHQEIADRSRKEGWDYFTSVQNGVFCKLGNGNVNFERIVNILQTMNYDDWIVVEQDVLPGMGSPEVCALNNRNYLKSIGL